VSDAFLNHVKQLAAFDGHIEVWAAGPSCANTFSHQSGSSIIARAGVAIVSAGWKVRSKRCCGCIESHEDRADD